MGWNKALVQYYCEHYYQLIEYELNPFEQLHMPSLTNAYVSGSTPNLSNYAETADLNWEFDKALKKLGKDEARFREIFIDSDGKDDELLDRFMDILYNVEKE